MENDKIVNGNCWVAYFDLLGFKKELEGQMDIDVQGNYKNPENSLVVFVEEYYFDILRSLKKKENYNPDKVFTHWFSDTFLFYTSDDSPESFCCIDMAARHFFVEAIQKKMPLRGALGVGPFYADKENNIFVGPALVQVYEWAEKQNWIGMVITPQAHITLQNVHPDSNLARSNYIEYDVPVRPVTIETERLPAYRFGKIPYTEEPITQLKKEAENKLSYEEYNKVKVKYDNTLKFLKES